ncbi:hypothetical protein [Variovorax sp. OV700]|uniref:hypothetical protein n=1 Tax=Variovorax sp. OV700 TaxID=1882826 RepID=UPI000B816420|nr:hypothetical protein [Variovorax sp. OV700]
MASRLNFDCVFEVSRSSGPLLDGGTTGYSKSRTDIEGSDLHADEFLIKTRDPHAWRTHARALRRSADALWNEFSLDLTGMTMEDGDSRRRTPDLDRAMESLETTKLLYGLALETALKAWIVEHHPEKIEFRVSVDGGGAATSAELRTLGVPTSSGHNILALAEAVGLFRGEFSDVLKFDSDRSAMRNICRDLSEVVLWRGRYPIPLASGERQKLDSGVDRRATAHYIRDWLDPVLDRLLITDLAM